ERDLHAVALGQAGDHVQPQPLGHRQVDLLGGGQQVVGDGEVLGQQADPPVLDGEDVAAGGLQVGAGADAHVGLGRGEAHGVLDQLGHEVGDVRDRVPEHGQAVVDVERAPVQVLVLADA